MLNALEGKNNYSGFVGLGLQFFTVSAKTIAWRLNSPSFSMSDSQLAGALSTIHAVN